LKTVVTAVVIVSLVLAVAAGIAANITGQFWLLGLSALLVAPLWFLRPIVSLEAHEARTADRRGNQVKVDVIQNGPFETQPYGSQWYDLNSRIDLKAFPLADHPFKLWTSNTNLVEILNPASASTEAIIKGPGTITANFY
jgi:hypothetical protein